MRRRRFLIGAVVLVIVMIAGYTIADRLVRNKVEMALRSLPPSLGTGYSGLHVNLFTRSVIIEGLHGRGFAIGRVRAEGIGFLSFVRTHRLGIDRVWVDSFRVEKEGLSIEGRAEVDSVSGLPGSPDSLQFDSLRFGQIRADVDRFRYELPASDEVVIGKHLGLDGRQKLLRLDTLRIVPLLDKLEIGRKRGHQVDVADATVDGIKIEGLDIMGLMRQRLTADKITVDHDQIYVFRDRRLPLERGEKAMPMEGLKSLPVKLRVGEVDIGPTFFEYEEFPAKGDKTGELKIYRMRAHISPLINDRQAGDPAYITMRTEGSLMNSGSVTATTRMPLHAGEPYEVEGAFHDLDVTRLNDPAENLGKLHLESGMLNFLSFHFVMTTEKSTGQIIGEYHDLVVDKLKDNGKVAKLKSFALKKFIIPRNKDKRLPVKKRTGKVEYRRDPERYFSYYLLHSLLVGVKSSFSLGFLLPG